MNRADFQRLAELRIREAKVLLDNGLYEGAYYLAGYAVECALKACIAKQTRRYDFPPDARTVQDRIYTHDLTKLLVPAELKPDHEAEMQVNATFRNFWTTVKDWSEQGRYSLSVTEKEAIDMYDAITDRKDGVLTWLKKRW